MRLALVLMMFIISLVSYGRQKVTTRENYSSFLKRLVQNVELSKKDSIIYAFPLTSNEASIFYNLDYDKQTSSGFRKLLDKIHKLCLTEGMSSLDTYTFQNL